MSETINESVKLIFSLSISGGLFALALFALKPFMRNRLSKSFQYYIWIVVLLRFMLPFSFGINLMEVDLASETSHVLNKTMDAITDFVTTTQSVETVEAPPNYHSEFADDTANEYISPVAQPTETTETVKENSFNIFKIFTDNLLWIWLAGVIMSTAFNIIGYTRFIRHIQGKAYAVEVPNCKVKVFKSRFAPTPMLVGVFRPRIYLPDIEYADEQLKNIMLHELTHLRRRDVWLKWFVSLVVSVHWFNPIVYFMRREINRACEISCDEAVIRNLDGAAKQSYGNTLISVVAESRTPVGVMSTTMCQEKKKLKERLVAIMNYRKKTKIAVLITAVLAVAITISACVFGAQSGNFAFWKTSYFTISFPYEKISDISAEDMEALILSELNNPKTDIYIYNPQIIQLKTDYSLKFFMVEVLVSELDNNGNFVRRVYEISISPENKKMGINHRDYAELVNSDFNYCRFSDFWNALSLIPADALSETITKGTPNYYSLSYTPYNRYNNSSAEIKHIFYDMNGVIESYRESPSVMFDFTPMYQDENDPHAFSGIGMTIIYYYNQQDITTDSVAEDDSFNISLADLRQLAAKGDELVFEDFNGYDREDVGFGIFVLSFKIEGGYTLLLGFGNLTGTPYYADFKIPGIEEHIDIRYDDIDEFINKYLFPTD